MDRKRRRAMISCCGKGEEEERSVENSAFPEGKVLCVGFFKKHKEIWRKKVKRWKIAAFQSLSPKPPPPLKVLFKAADTHFRSKTVKAKEEIAQKPSLYGSHQCKECLPESQKQASYCANSDFCFKRGLFFGSFPSPNSAAIIISPLRKLLFCVSQENVRFFGISVSTTNTQGLLLLFSQTQKKHDLSTSTYFVLFDTTDDPFFAKGGGDGWCWRKKDRKRIFFFSLLWNNSNVRSTK